MGQYLGGQPRGYGGSAVASGVAGSDQLGPAGLGRRYLEGILQIGHGQLECSTNGIGSCRRLDAPADGPAVCTPILRVGLGRAPRRSTHRCLSGLAIRCVSQVFAGQLRCPGVVVGSFDGYRQAMEMADGPNVGLCLCVDCWPEEGWAS